jgi:hypothetical protein
MEALSIASVKLVSRRIKQMLRIYADNPRLSSQSAASAGKSNSASETEAFRATK